MHNSPAPVLLLALCAFLSCRAATAAESECMKYVPAADKIVSVPCGEFKAAAPAASEPAPPAVAGPPAPATDPHLAKMIKTLSELTASLKEAKSDSNFRDTFCSLNATGQILRKEKDKREIKRLQSQHEALEGKVGQRGRDVFTALQPQLMDMVLGTPVDDAVPSTELRQTAEGQAFVNARDGLHLSCNCLYENTAPHRLVCCDSCDQEALKAKAAAAVE
jgi:hypothetical protein